MKLDDATFASQRLPKIVRWCSGSSAT